MIAQIWRLIYRQLIHTSKIKHAREALDYNTKELILDTDIIEK